MPPQNGDDQSSENTKILIGLVARLNDALRDFSVEQRLSSERLARLESVVDKAREAISRVEHGVSEARDDIEATREQTDPRGFRLLDPARYPLGETAPYRNGKDTGKSLAIADGKVKVALSTAWVVRLLQFAMSAGAGGLILRLVQWLATGH